VETLVLRLLEHRPRERMVSATAFIEAVRRLQAPKATRGWWQKFLGGK
jgi:hypothetical protein